MASIALRDLTFTYPPSDPDAGSLSGAESLGKAALSHVSVTIPDGTFVTLYGENGSGKSTLLRLIKREIAPLGSRSGEILLDGTPTDTLSDRDSACRIGYVAQQPEEQIVTDRVWHELAFGCENLGMAEDKMRRRVAEIACMFGMEDWFERDTASLSGGQKQLLSLAAVMAMDPDVLLLDEPTAQLDPIAAVEFFSVVARFHREFSLTIVLVTHALEEVLPYTDRLLVLEKGSVLAYDTPSAVLERLRNREDMLPGLPVAMRLFHEYPAPCPVTIREGKAYLRTHFANTVRTRPMTADTPLSRAAEMLSFRDVWFRYRKNAPDVLRGLTFSVRQGEIFCVLGGNGSGKSTMLSVTSGWHTPYAGTVRVCGKRIRDYGGDSLFRDCLAYLPQDVTTLFACPTVESELAEVGASVPDFLMASAHTHPYDLSGGQKQLLALTKVLATHPRLLLLDEPTKGLDGTARERIARTLRGLRDDGLTIVCVTHDVDFAAAIADRCAFFFRGEITSIDTPRRFFADNRFYTTAVSRITRGYFDNTVTVADAKALCAQNGYRKGE